MSADRTDILSDIDAMLRAVLGDFDDGVEITMDSTFRDDLGLESLDVVSLAGRLQARYGDAVNFAQFVAGLDVASMGELRVGQLVDHIAGSLDRVPTR
ncbi:acyl carrier protein [Mangrovihabitans endophyticus]|uniref:Acyl carrier protein n=1 Tax=Mangrovihabitans endophyticus TaxID=1751298 RepID=A0A8J3BYV8_9ACTN|nr:acyl carrier protein [Mangrovihabitans endophyticus]GGK83898.1 acyl carrier protein [Mangrovihabitans endophyticus]